MMRKSGGGKIGDYRICPPKDILPYVEEDVFFVISTFHYENEIRTQLIRMGISESKIIIAKELDFIHSLEYYAYIEEIDLQNPVPKILNIEFSGYCNCRCIHCPFHGELNLKKNRKGFMEWEILDAIIELVNRIPTITTVDTTGPGEIFLHKNWFEMLNKLLEKTSIKNVYMYTNGMLLNDDNVDKIMRLRAESIQLDVSIDGQNPKENDEYRIGSQYSQVKTNVTKAFERFQKSEKNIKMIITNCYPYTISEIQDANYKINSKENALLPQFLKEDFPGIQIASQRMFSCGGNEYSKFNSIEVEWKGNDRDNCLNLFYRLPIDYSGQLLRCSCSLPGVEGIGSIFEDDVLELWYNDKEIVKARHNFISHEYEDNFCKGCPGRGKGTYQVMVKK